MLGVGWTEMLVIGVVALVVIGPKELPAVMHKIGRFAGTVRRMGADFQRELNKTTGLDEVKNLRNAITQPLKQTTDAIRKEFNTVGPNGAVQPSGALKPADPNAESVVDEIKAKAGMTPTPAQTPAESIKAAVKKATEPAAPDPVPQAAATPAKPKRVVKAAGANPVTPDLPAVKPKPKRPAAKAEIVKSPAPAKPKPAAKPKAATAAAKPKPAAKPAAKPEAVAKPPAKRGAAAKAPAKRRAPAKPAPASDES